MFSWGKGCQRLVRIPEPRCVPLGSLGSSKLSYVGHEHIGPTGKGKELSIRRSCQISTPSAGLDDVRDGSRSLHLPRRHGARTKGCGIGTSRKEEQDGHQQEKVGFHAQTLSTSSRQGVSYPLIIFAVLKKESRGDMDYGDDKSAAASFNPRLLLNYPKEWCSAQ